MLVEIAIGDAYGAGFEFCGREKIDRHNTLAAYVPHELGIAAGRYEGLGELGACSPTEGIAVAEARAQAAVTHDTPEGTLSSHVVALMAHALLHEQADPADLPRLVERETGFALRSDWSAEVECDAIQTLHAVNSALQRHRSVQALLRDCVDFGGDVDSVAAIAMGLASLSPAYDADIPQPLVEGLEDGDHGLRFLAALDAQLAASFPVLARRLQPRLNGHGA